MANAKISNNAIFVPETADVRNIDGIAGYKGSANAKITGTFLAQSVVNEGGSGIGVNDGTATAPEIRGRVAFYGVGNPSNTLGGSQGFEWHQANSTDGIYSSLRLGVPGGTEFDAGLLVLNGNYITTGSNKTGKLEFRQQDVNNPGGYLSFIITTADEPDENQTWVLPGEKPGTTSMLTGIDGAGDKVSLDWADLPTNTTYDFKATASTAGSNDDPFLSLTDNETTPNVDNVKLIGGTDISISKNANGDQVTIQYTGTDDNTTYTLGTTQSTSNGQITLTDSVVGSTPQTVTLSGGGTVSVSSDASGGVIISGSSTPGGSSAFATITTDSTTGDAEWDYTNDGPNIEWKPEFPNASFWNLLKMKNNVMPSDGDHGYLILDPSVTSVFQLPSNSLILNGDVLPGGTNITTYEWVYDGTNFHWEKQPNQVQPTYAPFNPFPSNNLIGVFDPDTINPQIRTFRMPFKDSSSGTPLIPNDAGTSGSSGTLTVNYAVPNGGTWTNSLTGSNILGNLTAATNPAGSSSDYPPSFVVNYTGGLKLDTYQQTIPNPDASNNSNSQTFYFYDFSTNGTSGTYTTQSGEHLRMVELILVKKQDLK